MRREEARGRRDHRPAKEAALPPPLPRAPRPRERRLDGPGPARPAGPVVGTGARRGSTLPLACPQLTRRLLPSAGRAEGPPIAANRLLLPGNTRQCDGAGSCWGVPHVGDTEGEGFPRQLFLAWGTAAGCVRSRQLVPRLLELAAGRRFGERKSLFRKLTERISFRSLFAAFCCVSRQLHPAWSNFRGCLEGS